jgi:hypothetical protein
VGDALLDRACERIADGRPVSWHELEDRGTDADLVRCLRVLQDIANLHRASEDELETPAASAKADATPPAQDPVGTYTWGRYRLDEAVGRGSFGEVYRAWDPDLEREVAVKILHRHVADSRLRAQLLREGRALAKVRHLNVVTVLGVEAHEDRVGLCMEFIQGETLADRLQDHGLFSAREAALIGEDLCRALAAVHRAGFIHRDVKARNVMREQAGRIVLMDFGTGRAADNPELQDDLTGTPLYMAPEVLGGEPASARSDVYSVGVLLHHLVTAEYPVDARTVEDLREAHLRGRRQRLSERRPDLPLSFIRVVERALAPDPEERFRSAGALLEALETVRGVVRIPARRKVAYGAAAAAALLVGVVGLGAIVSTSFNITLERSAFATETWGDWFTWGRRAALGPILVAIPTALAVLAAAILWRLLTHNVQVAQRLEARVRRLAREFVRSRRLDAAPLLARYVLLISGAALLATLVAFGPLIAASSAYVSSASEEQLAVLAPDLLWYHNKYRWTLNHVVLLSVVSWIPVLKLARKGPSLPWGLVAGGVLVTLTAVAFLQFPYRLLYFSDEFRAVSWRGERCYVIGERAEDLLLFCPKIALPRNRIVHPNDRAIVPLDVIESIFTPFSSTPAATGGAGI